MLAEEGEHLAPAIHCLLGSVEWPVPIEDGVAATGTGAEHADLAVVIRLRAHPLHRGLGIADHLGVGNAAVGAHFGGNVVRVALARTLIEVSANPEIAVMREPTRRLDVEFAPAREMVDKHDARKEARTRWLGHVSRYRRSFVVLDGHV